MAPIHGKDANFRLDDSSGTLRDISAYLASVGFPRSVDTADMTNFTKDDHVFVTGLKGGTISLEGPWDTILDGYLAPALGQAATQSFEYGPAGSTTGFIKYLGECIMTSYEVSPSVSEGLMWSAELTISDAVTRTTWA